MRIIAQTTVFYFLLLILVATGTTFIFILPGHLGLYSYIIVAAMSGLGVTLGIRHVKKNHKTLVCPTGSNCNAVITSRYSVFLGVHLEYWGMLYYGFTILAYGFLLALPNVAPAFFAPTLVILSAGGFLFSLYLLFVQAFILKQWCMWCFLSAIISISIFLSSLISVEIAPLVARPLAEAVLVLREFGFVLGVGGSVTVLFLFKRFVADRKISSEETRTLQSVSEITLFGLILTLTSQLAIYVLLNNSFDNASVYAIQTLALIVAALASAGLILVYEPLLPVIPFKENDDVTHPSRFAMFRRPLLALSLISFSSWFFVFMTQFFEQYFFTNLFVAYSIVLVIALLCAIVWDKSITRA